MTLETMWNIKQDYHTSGAIAVFEQDGVPVLVAHTGRYPQAMADDGRTTQETPHILISVGGGTINGVQFFSGVTVHAVGTWHHGRRRQLNVFSDVSYDGSRRDSTPDIWVSLGKSKIVDAIAALASMDSQYEVAEAIVARVSKYDSPVSRGEYEAACAACDVEPLSDDDCLSYGVKYGDFSFPEYDAGYIAKMHLAFRRLQQLEAEREEAELARPASPPVITARQGQLWEPCERCGAEPVYMPLNLCDRCWPK